jgi:uncharacterized membrane protein YdbT with pleckstrin-like domain
MHIPLFPGHEPDEQIIMFVHRHRIAFLIPLLIIFVLVILPLFFIFAGPSIGFDPLGWDWGIAGLGAYFLFAISVAFVLWVDYYYDLLVITDQHIVNIEQDSLLGRRVSYVSLLRVQDANGKTSGLLQSLLNYGTILIETAGETPDIVQRDVANPSEIAHKVMELHDALITKEGRSGEVTKGEGTHPAAEKEHT